jgi:hypothetical protein
MATATMTTSEWLTCEDSHVMLAAIKDHASNRKLRLLAVAFARRVEDLMTDPRSTAALTVAERFADGLASTKELAAASDAARDAARDPASDAAWDAVRTSAREAVHAVAWHATWNAASDTARDATCKSQCDIIREIVADPYAFAPAISPTWLAWHACTVAQLARAIYDERAFDRLPILADAIEEAGCTDPAILGHCRGAVPHARGCWVIDILLGLE